MYPCINRNAIHNNKHKVINSGYSHRSVPAQELHCMAAPSVGGSITAQSVQPQEEIPEEGRKNTKKLTTNMSVTY